MNKTTDIITSMNTLRDIICCIERLSARLYGQTEVEEFRLEFILQTLNSVEQSMVKKDKWGIT